MRKRIVIIRIPPTLSLEILGGLIGPNTGSNSAQNTANILGVFLDFLGCLMYSLIFWGFLILPKWLINDSRHIPILFGSFMELPKCSPNLAPYTLYSNHIHYGNIFKSYYFSYLNLLEIQNVQLFDTTGHQHC